MPESAVQTHGAAASGLVAQNAVTRSTGRATAVSAPKPIAAPAIAPSLPAAGQSVALAPSTGSSTRQALPFTGLDINILTLIGLAMLLAGAAIRINATRPTRCEQH
jgi:hypothetical protein